MMINFKELSKFISGAAAIEIINHLYLAISNVLPLRILGIFVISKTINLVILAAWFFVFVASVYYSWIKNRNN